jgi:DNA primase
MNVKDLVEELGYTPKKKASSNGGEFSSPCPFCKAGDDRFSTWPERFNNNGEYKGGRFSCRVCNKSGDAITFLRELHGLSFQEACAKLGITLSSRSGIAELRETIKPQITAEPSDKWKETATAFVNWAFQNSRADKNITSLLARGFAKETIARFKLGFNPTTLFRNRNVWGLADEVKENGELRKLWLPSGVIIPTFGLDCKVIKIKIRRIDYERERQAYDLALSQGNKSKWEPQKYAVVSGSSEALSVYGDTSRPIALIVESELDAMLLQQEAGDLAYCVALGGCTKLVDAGTDLLLRSTPNILFCPDSDEAGKRSWNKWRQLFSNIHCTHTPCEKSAGDYFKEGGNLRKLIQDSIDGVKKKTLETR